MKCFRRHQSSRHHERAPSRAGVEAIQAVVVLAVGAIALLVITAKWPVIQEFFGSHMGVSTEWDETERSNFPLKDDDTVAPPNSSLLENTLVFGALIGVISWAGREVVLYVRLRAEMAVLELLSDDTPRSYDEIIAASDQGEIHLRLWVTRLWGTRRLLVHPSITDALATLVSKGAVEIFNKKYHKADGKKAA